MSYCLDRSQIVPDVLVLVLVKSSALAFSVSRHSAKACKPDISVRLGPFVDEVGVVLLVGVGIGVVSQTVQN